jgi:ABC-type antimicrobial peptide transport system permease subunit
MMLGITAFVVFLLLWGLAWRYQIKFAFGILIGLVIGGILAQFIGPFNSVEDIPVWLPPMPLVFIVVVLFLYAFLAWYVLDYRANKK